jgi:hypothetical protein
MRKKPGAVLATLPDAINGKAADTRIDAKITAYGKTFLANRK